ncbi:MAG: hypothetical protein ACR2IJ_05190 [Fluviibacter sp.]
MTQIPRNGHTLKQYAYARRVWGAKGADKKNIALDVGYSMATANKVKEKIESSPGFNNAIAKLAAESNNMAVAVLSEFKARGLKDFSNKDLVGALNAIGGAWAKFNAIDIETAKSKKNPEGNRLRAVIMNRIENQTINNPTPIPAVVEEVKEIDLDF